MALKLVMTLLARDEADIVDAQLAFHLNAGVDFVIATDNLSQDGTTEILESYAKTGQFNLIREDGQYLQQAEWITRMGRLWRPRSVPTGSSTATPMNSGGRAETR